MVDDSQHGLFEPANNPAFSGFMPTLTWQNLSQTQQTHLTKIRADYVNIERISTNHAFPFGYYRARHKQTNTLHFFKITTINHAKKILAAEEICQFLAHTIATNPIKNHSSCHIVNQDAVLIEYAYKAFSPYKLEAKYLIAIAQQLALMHAKLSTFADRDQVLNRHQTKMNSLCELHEDLKLTKLTKHQIPENNLLLAKERLPEVLQTKPWHQVIHGDLNTGNILFEKQQVTILDFEDAIQTYSCPWQDISYFIERFIILPSQSYAVSKQNMQQHILCFLRAYEDNNTIKHIAQQNTNILAEWLQALALKANLILIQQHLHFEQDIKPSEWQKFTYLYQLATKNSLLWQEVIEQWLS